MNEVVSPDAAIVQSPSAPRSALRFSKAITRYWGEALVVAIALLVWAPRLTGPIDLRWDAGVYYVLGTSLATGQGYRMLSEPGSPEALQYPPLLPAVVALYERALGSTDAAVVGPWLRLSYALLFLLYGLAVLALARRYLPAAFAVAAVAISLLQVNTLFMSDLLFTELPFAMLSVLFVLVSSNELLASRPRARDAISFVLAAAGFLLRTAGVALLIAWILESCVRRRWRSTVVRGLLALLPLVAWQMHVTRVQRSYEYAHPAYEYQRAPYQFYNVSYAENSLPGVSANDSISIRARAFGSRLTSNLRLIGKRLGEAISSSQGYWNGLFAGAQRRVFSRQMVSSKLVLAPILALSMLVVTGIGILIRRRAWLIVLVVVTSVGLICTTPWPGQFQRYLMPLTPFLAIAALLAASEISNALRILQPAQSIRIAGRIAIMAVVVIGLIVETYAALYLFAVRERGGARFMTGHGPAGSRFFYLDPLWRGWEQAIAWIQEYGAPNAIVATPYSHLCYLLTGRHAVSPPVESDPGRVRYLLESVPVSYVIVDRDYSLPAIESDTVGWQLIQNFDGTRLYQNKTMIEP